MKFLLDTNVLSEWVKPRPDPGLVTWLAEVDEDQVHISVITLAELRHGVMRMPPGRRRMLLDKWLVEEIPLRFGNRILPIDETVADSWGILVAQREASGKRIAPMDAFIAATALVNKLTLVTRNVADFKPSLKDLICPWSA